MGSRVDMFTATVALIRAKAWHCQCQCVVAVWCFQDSMCFVKRQPASSSASSHSTAFHVPSGLQAPLYSKASMKLKEDCVHFWVSCLNDNDEPNHSCKFIANLYNPLLMTAPTPWSCGGRCPYCVWCAGKWARMPWSCLQLSELPLSHLPLSMAAWRLQIYYGQASMHWKGWSSDSETSWKTNSEREEVTDDCWSQTATPTCFWKPVLTLTILKYKLVNWPTA